jgi:diadenosine tetraphosphate (Ap4A) HIT family hydrolase
MKKIVLSFLALSLCATALFKIDLQGSKKWDGCAFCRKELLDAQVFYRGDQALGILTYKPAVPGHVLIIPARHVERFEDLTLEEIKALGEMIQKVDKRVRAVFHNKDYVLIQKNGPLAGQTVPHVHFHYLPGGHFLGVRYLLSPIFKPLAPSEIEHLKEKLTTETQSYRDITEKVDGALGGRRWLLPPSRPPTEAAGTPVPSGAATI